MGDRFRAGPAAGRRVGAVAAVVLALASTAATVPATATPNPPPAPGTATSPAVPTPAPTSTIGGADLLRPGVVVARRTGVPIPPTLEAGSYVVADLNDGRVILAKNAHVRSRPASTLKTLTALTVMPRLAPDTVVRALPQDAAIDGTKVGMMPGSSYTVHQLLLGLMLNSGNDAANALARANGGMATTASQMNAYAHRLGAVDTEARNTSGLDATGQLTSAYDLALLGRAAVENPDLAPYLTTKTAKFPGRHVRGVPGPGSFEINNHNRLLWNYDGMIGVKNGYTKAAGQTYIGAARRGDQAYVVTYLAGNGVGWRDTAALLDWAFAHGRTTGPVGRLVEPGEGDGPTSPAASPPVSAGAGPTQAAASVGGVDLSPDDGRGRLALFAGGAVVLAGAGALGLRRLRRGT